MFGFEVIQELKPNDEILEIIKNYEYTVKNGKIKHLKATNLQFIEPCRFVKHMSHLTVNTNIEIPNMLFLNFNLLYILNTFPLDLTSLMASLENYYILLSNILLYLLNLQNY